MARVFLSISASVSCRNPPTSSHPRRPTHVLPPTSSGFPAFRTPAGRRTHDPARRAFLPRREGAGQAPGALCSVVEGRGRRHRRFCAPPSPGPGRFRGWSAPAAFPRAAVLTGSQTSVQLLVTSSARSVRPPRANRFSFHFKALLVSPRFSGPGPSRRPLGRPIPPLLVVNLPEFTSDKSISVLPAGNNPNLNN